MKCLDGPAGSVLINSRRCPMYVRVVRDAFGRWDVLDQLDDQPKPGERVFVYRRVPGTWRQVFIRPGGEYQNADYRHMPDVVAETLRDNVAWRAWAEAQPPIGE